MTSITESLTKWVHPINPMGPWPGCEDGCCRKEVKQRHYYVPKLTVKQSDRLSAVTVLLNYVDI